MSYSSEMSRASVSFRDYLPGDLARALEIFEANCPEFFAPDERAEYLEFLTTRPAGYQVATVAGRVVGAFGLIGADPGRRRLNWILIDPASQGSGIGSAIMERVVATARAAGVRLVEIAASHRSDPFFARFGARLVTVTPDGWGPGMHRHDMELEVA